MINFRAIPSLILRNNNFVKGQRFKNHNYVGDPRNIIKIFNDKDVDEILIVNPFLNNLTDESLFFLSKVISHCFLPVTYGGGVKTIKDIENLNKIGVEKYLFKFNSNFDFRFLKKVSDIKGQQSVVLHIPFFKINNRIALKKGTFRKKYLDLEILKDFSRNVGEIVFTDINNEGLRNGPINADLISPIVDTVDCPVLFQGGIRNSLDLKSLKEKNFSGALLGAAYIFAGSKNSVNIGYFK